MKVERIETERLELNIGQIEGLPANPRSWTREDIDRIAKSLKETPELFEMRPCIVYPQGDKYIVLAGNLRFCGARQNGDPSVPCFVLPQKTSKDKLKEIVIKDNGSFGTWDIDAIKNDWAGLPLVDWGLPEWSVQEGDGEPLPGFLEGDGAGPGQPKDEKITIVVPAALADKLEDIKQSVRLTLEEWEGCEVQ